MTADVLVVEPRELSGDQQAWVEKAWSQIDASEIRDLALDITSIPSPTGEERALAEYFVSWMGARGLEAWYQPIDSTQGNAIGRCSGDGSGAELLLYAPMDTLTTGLADEDCPWIGPALRPDMRPEGTVRGDWIVGLGASNPKGHAACMAAAAAAIQRAGIPLRGSVLVGLCAGGMPTNKRPRVDITRYNAGQGSGCSFMLEQGIQADFAIIAKPGATVAWEEVGLCWFRIEIRGNFGYVGSRHRIPYRNAIVDASRVVSALEDWFPEYTRRNTSGLVAPQGNVGAIEGGWARTASLSPAACHLLVDVRVSPRTTPMDVKRQFSDALQAIRSSQPGLELSWEMVLAIPGTSTPPDNWIIQACARAWEKLEGEPIRINPETSGATDANILRHRGLPTARIGMPKLVDPDGAEVDFALGMNAVDVADMVRLTKLVVHSAIATCTPTIDELGIQR